jgi:arsenate reductase
VIEYLKERPDRATLEHLVSILEDSPTDLVRRDSQFKKLGLSEADVETNEQIVNLLLDKPRLMQRPVVVMGERAIIGRPKARVLEFLSGP